MPNDVASLLAQPVAPPATSSIPLVRTRLALALICAVGVALELTLMRGLALRFWSHLACMVISVGLLGFGAAGTFLTLLRPRVLRDPRSWLSLLALLLAASVPITWWASQTVPLDVKYLAWSYSEVKHVLAIELLMFVPFFLTGAFVGVVLMDLPQRINGHYASDLVGSGIGGIVAVMAMNVLSTTQLLVALTIVGFCAALLLVRWCSWKNIAAAVLLGLLTAATVALMPWEPALSQYKYLAQARTWAGSKVIYQSEGPLGRIDVLAGPAIHYAPQLSLQFLDDTPPQVVLITDGSGLSPIYQAKTVDDWNFLDYRTAAAPFALRTNPRVCIIGAGGGSEIGLALYHKSPAVTALEMNPQIIAAMNGPLAPYGGSIYSAPGVRVINQEARGFFAATPDAFDIIQLPLIDGFGASGSGLYATQESYIYTIESVRAMFQHLAPGGILSITRWVQSPPREELRAFDMAAQALRAQGLDPKTHLAMLRSWITTTILVSQEPLAEGDIAGIRAFCKKRGFDLCYLPGVTLTPQESNRFHVLDKEMDFKTNRIHTAEELYYVQGTKALLGEMAEREEFLAGYPFAIAAPTDDQPYFFHTFRWASLPKLREQLGAGSNAQLEMGYLMLAAALAQTVLLGLLLVLLPLTPGIRALRHSRAKTVCLGYFLMLGLGFMLLEMGFVQKLVLYLAHPLYAAAVVIASFLVFAGLGSQFSHSWRIRPDRVVLLAGGVVIVFSVAFLLALDGWLNLTQSWGVPARCVIAALTIAPLAFAMGHFFPMGLQRTARANPALVPWSWAVNGFASVVAAAAAPLLAMRFGFSWVVAGAVGCYVLAGLLFRHIPAADPNQKS